MYTVNSDDLFFFTRFASVVEDFKSMGFYFHSSFKKF